MTVLDRIKSFFKRPRAKAKAEPPKAPEAPEKKAGEGSQQGTGTT